MFHCQPYLENLVDLVDFGFPREERLLGKELAEDATHGPHVHRGGVLLLGRERAFRGSTLECKNI